MVSPANDSEILSDDDQLNPEDSSPSDALDNETAEESSTSEESDSGKSTFDLIDEVLNQEKVKSEEDDTEGSQEEDDSEEKGSDEPKKSDEVSDDEELSDDELKGLKVQTRNRMKKLQQRLRERTDERDDLKQKYEAVEVDAQNYRNIVGYLENNDLSQEDANEILHIGALMKRDPQKALELMTPAYNQLLEITGNVLPADLQKRVEEGYTDQEDALRLSRAMAANNITNVTRQQEQYRQQQMSVARQQKVNQDIQQALTDLHNQWEQTDSDYKHKLARIQDRSKLAWFEASRQGRMPQSVDEAVQMVTNIKREVENEMRSLMPKRKSVQTVESGSASKASPAPTTTMQVFDQILGG